MKERPILFSGPMVRALLDGRKTQTRRIVKDARGAFWDHRGYEPRVHDGVTCWHWIADGSPANPAGPARRCPYGVPGDRLWARETWGTVKGSGIRVVYRADGDPIDAHYGNAIPDMVWTPSIYMPRKHSRITLAVASVRVERLQDITESDARAEGVEPRKSQDFWSCFCAATHDVFDMSVEPGAEYMRTRGITHVQHRPGDTYTAADEFRRLWQEINGKRAPWSSDPWVWVIEFPHVDGEAGR